MAKKVLHLAHPFYDSTLCGDADDGVMLEEVPVMVTGSQRVTCKHCLSMIKACVDYSKRAAKVKAQNAVGILGQRKGGE